MVTAAYWQNMLNSESNVFPKHCSIERNEFAFTYSRFKQGGMTFDDFVNCSSFVSYWCMWLNFAIMLLMSCCLSYAAHRARDAHHDHEEGIPLNSDPGKSYQTGHHH